MNSTITTPVAAPTIELRKLKVCKFMSEETTCYEAEVWVNGKRGFHASNDGHGGCDDYTAIFDRATNSHDRAAYDTAMEVLKTFADSLPPEHTGLPANDAEARARGEHFMLEQDVETLIGDALEDALCAKASDKYLKKMSTHIFFLTKDGSLSHLKLKVGVVTPEILARAAARYPKDTLVNTLPESEQRAILRKF